MVESLDLLQSLSIFPANCLYILKVSRAPFRSPRLESIKISRITAVNFDSPAMEAIMGVDDISEMPRANEEFCFTFKVVISNVELVLEVKGVQECGAALSS